MMIRALSLVLLSAPLLGQEAGTIWKLENSALKAEVAFHPSRGVALTSLLSRSGIRYVEPQSPTRLFLMKVRLERHAAPPNGRNPPLVNQVLEKKEYVLDGSGKWEMAGADYTQRDGTQLRLRLRRAEPGIEVVLQLRLRPVGKSGGFVYL